MIEQIKQTADFIKSKVSQMPQTAIILGTGLGELVNHIDITEELNYQDRISQFRPWKDIAGNLYSGNSAKSASWQCKDVSTSMRDTTCDKSHSLCES